RASAGTCDPAEVCDGLSNNCPTNAFASSTTVCAGTSQGGACDDTDHCNGSGVCVDEYKASTVVCRASAGQCDVAESCTGSSGACPANGFATTATVCSGASNGGDCDATDHCDGRATTVDDDNRASSVGCGASGDECDVAESCTGSSGTGP